MHYLVIGETGQLARALKYEIEIDIGKTATFLDRKACDLSASSEDVREAIAPFLSQADALIIAAAYTAVDAAEDDYETALAVNAQAPGVIAAAAAGAGCPVVHVSTDYVFGGDASSPYTPDMPIDPLNAYGRSKAKGEIAVLAGNPRSVILRTSWVYDGVGKNFLTTMLRLGETRDTLNVVMDQIGRPTYAQDLAKACLLAAETLKTDGSAFSGIYHVSNAGEPISWATFAEAIFQTAGLSTIVKGIPSSDYPTPAKRPAYSVMDIALFESIFEMTLPSWQEGLERALKERLARN